MNINLKSSVDELKGEGDVFIDQTKLLIYIWLPKDLGACHFNIDPNKPYCWTWNGNLTSPTLLEELYTPGARGWWLTEGVLHQ